MNPKNYKIDAKKKNLLVVDSEKLVESSTYMDEIFFCSTVQKEVNLSILHHMEEKDMTKLFDIKIQVNKTNVDALFNSDSHANLIVEDLANKLGLEVHDHPNPYMLGWVNFDAYLKVTKQCNIKFSTSADYIEM
jgi:hypothetical protein